MAAPIVISALALTAAARPAAAAATAPSSLQSSCAWGAKSDPDVVNAAYPDTSANYWSYQYKAVPGTELVIHGSYPHARYFSFHVYQPNAVPIDSIYDMQIRPDAGSANRFTGPAAATAGGSYTVTVLFGPKPAHPAANTLYAGQTQIDGSPNPGGVLMMRTYLPADPTSPQGSVPLPTVTWRTTGGNVLDAASSCSSDLPSTNGLVAQELNSQSFPIEQDSPGAAAITWSRAGSSPYVGAFGNQQNAYLTATISRANGDLVVVHGRAPTFPNARAGEPVYAPAQLRYWSICENSVSTRVISCVPDQDAPLVNGYYTYVISDPSVRPANATTANGVAWLPWGSIDAGAAIILRNMVPGPGFAQAAQNVPSSGGPGAPQVMGAYYPAAVYCSPATFAAGGWQACFGKQPPSNVAEVPIAGSVPILGAGLAAAAFARFRRRRAAVHPRTAAE
jgi:hypothetical protein